MVELPFNDKPIDPGQGALSIIWENIVLQCRKAGAGSLTCLGEDISENGGRTGVPS